MILEDEMVHCVELGPETYAFEDGSGRRYLAFTSKEPAIEVLRKGNLLVEAIKGGPTVVAAATEPAAAIPEDAVIFTPRPSEADQSEPPKVVMSTMPAEIEGNTIEPAPVSAPEPVKRGPGRPRKNPPTGV